MINLGVSFLFLDLYCQAESVFLCIFLQSVWLYVFCDSHYVSMNVQTAYLYIFRQLVCLCVFSDMSIYEHAPPDDDIAPIEPLEAWVEIQCSTFTNWVSMAIVQRVWMECLTSIRSNLRGAVADPVGRRGGGGDLL